MNSFLSNMIDRHRGVGDIVQPRPRSRFEQDTRPLPIAKTDSGDLGSNHDDFEIEQRRNAPLTQRSDVSPNQENPISRRPFTMENQPTIAHKEKRQSQQPTHESHSGQNRDIPRSRDDVPSILDRVQPSKEPLPLKHDDGPVANRGAQREKTKLHPNDETVSPPIDEGSFQTELSQRIQTLLQRLQGQAEPRWESNADIDRSAQLPSLLRAVEQEPSIPLATQRPDVRPAEDREISRQHLETPGALQIPAWLSDMQTDLNNRWREINAMSKVEPVVNVTIGRVEIRAVQANEVKQSKPQKKPTGVMSLDAYLRKRAYGGQA